MNIQFPWWVIFAFPLTPKEKNPLAAKVAALEKETRRLKARAERAEALVDLQKKVSEILGIERKRNGEKD